MRERPFEPNISSAQPGQIGTATTTASAGGSSTATNRPARAGSGLDVAGVSHGNVYVAKVKAHLSQQVWLGQWF